MDKVTQDFKFVSLYSAPYGRWLATVYDAVPDVTVTAVNDWYPRVANSTHVSVTVPEDIAMLLKLQFGSYLVERPAIHPSDLQQEKEKYEMIKMKIMKNRYTKETTNNNIWFDYESNTNKEGIVFKDYYDEMKKVSMDYYKKRKLIEE